MPTAVTLLEDRDKSGLFAAAPDFGTRPKRILYGALSGFRERMSGKLFPARGRARCITGMILGERRDAWISFLA
jgi:hypothetical protein